MIGRQKQLHEQAAAALLAALLGLRAAPGAAAAETLELSCQSPLWANLPLAKQQTPAAEYDPSFRSYYQEWARKHVLPPFVFCCLAAALLLAFLLWRLVKLATCMRCIRGPRLRGKPALELLSSRSMRWLRALVPLLAAGMVAGSGYGFSTIQPSIEPAGVAVYEKTKAYVASGLTQANHTLAAAERVEGQLMIIRQRTLDLNLEQLQPDVLTVIDDFHSSMKSITSGLQTAGSDIQDAVLDRMEAIQQDWQPLADRLDVVKNAALYACYALIIAFSVAVSLGTLLNCPGLVKGCIALLLFFILLAWAAVTASTAGLKIGSDGCTIVETKVIDALVAEAERQVATGKGVLSNMGVGDTLALARYFLYGVGKTPREVLYDLTGIDIPEVLASANQTVGGLQEAAFLLEGVQSSVRTLPDNLDTLAASINHLAGNVSALEKALSYEHFYVVYVAAKTYTCCSLLNFVAGVWLALLVVGCFGLPLSLAVFVWVGKMDKLEPRSCCHMYRRSDCRRYEEPALPAVPELPDKRDVDKREETEEGGGGIPALLLPLQPPRQLSAAHSGSSLGLSLHQKLTNASTWPRPGSGADTFRIGAAAAPPDSITPRSATGALESVELLPDATPSAPAMPLSARSLPSARAGAGCGASGGIQLGHWSATAPAAASAAGVAPLLQSARNTYSASNSACKGGGGSAGGFGNAGCSGGSYGAAQNSLTPAAAALLPPQLPRISAQGGPNQTPQPQDSSSAQDASTGSSGGGRSGGSALRRAGNALTKLKLTRRAA